MALRLSKEAEQDVAELYRFGTLNFGLAASTQYAEDLRDRLHFLSQFPRMARERDEVSPPIRILVHHSHLVAYRIEDEDVVVVRVLHHSMDWRTEL